MKKIVIFASGEGTNAENIIKFFYSHDKINVSEIYTNNKKAKVLKKAKKHKIPAILFDKEQLNSGVVLDKLKSSKIDLILLAGFLLKIPNDITKYYCNKIINIHPSLLPLFGGKGMYGLNVHQKVFDSNQKLTGITIHYVNHNYDEGQIIFQAKCRILPYMKVRDIAREVHKLEIKFLPVIIESLLNEKN